MLSKRKIVEKTHEEDMRRSDEKFDQVVDGRKIVRETLEPEEESRNAGEPSRRRAIS